MNNFPLSFYITFFGLIVMVTLVKLGGHNHDHGINIVDTETIEDVLLNDV